MNGWHFDRTKLRGERTRKAMTQQELADAAGISYVTVCRLETGARETPRLPTVAKLAKALGIEPERLMTLDKRKPPRKPPPSEDS
jgi:transcriptional regulator with XRE-family HTH domain